MKLEIASTDQMRDFGRLIGERLRGGEVLELIGDVGAGKTTLTKGIALGLGISEPVQSPTFNISRVYAGRDGLELRHYDFYRLSEAGVMQDELAEAARQDESITVVEWADVIEGAMPSDRLKISITPVGENSRLVELDSYGPQSNSLAESLK